MSTPDGSIRELLPRTWFPFFSRFGKLLEVQRQCVPKVLEGTDLVVCSPTASGKTEAVLAPLVEKLLADHWEGLSLLWVSPTRALVNDLAARFTHPLNSLEVSFARKTGDRPEFDPAHPATVLITTPESFDSLLSRHPAAFKPLNAVILDDIHLLDGTYRGDQIRVLLERVKRLGSKGIHVYALSATIEDPSSLGKRYLSDFEVVQVPASKGLEYSLLPAYGPFVDELISEFKRRGIRKVLVFVNSRAEAEGMVARFRKPPFLHRTFAHHGSLSKGEREEIEGFMNTSSAGICIATTTLELGIDIGDIDGIVLCGPPHDVRSLLQRVGRGSRRRQDYALAYGVYKDEWERLLFQALFQEAQAGRLEVETYSPHFSVGVQQIFSYLYQRRRVGTTLPAVKSVLKPIVPEEYVSPLLDHLSDKEYVTSLGADVFAPSDRLLRLARRGLIHSNIDSRPSEYSVVSVEDRRRLGSIQLLAPQFQLGGRSWEVVRTDRDTVWVKPALKRPMQPSRTFMGRNISWDYRIGQRLKERLFPNLQADEYPYVKIGETYVIFHFSGPIYGFLWQEAFQKEQMGTEDVEGKYIAINDASGLDQLLPEKGQLLQVIIDKARLFKRILSLGSFFRLLPRDLQLEAVAQALKLDGFITHLEKIAFKEVPDGDIASAMNILGKRQDSTQP